MNRDRFNSILGRVEKFYPRWRPDRETLDFYFKELGGMTERELEAACEYHMANYRSEPMVAHLKGKTKGKPEESEARRPRPDQHPAYRDHFELADKMLTAAMGGPKYESDYQSLFPVKPLVDAAMDVYRTFQPVYKDPDEAERSRKSAARGELSSYLIGEFKPLMQGVR